MYSGFCFVHTITMEIYMSKIQIKIDNQEKLWTNSTITPKNILEIGEKQEPYDNYVIFKVQNGVKTKVWSGQQEKLHEHLKVEDKDNFIIKYHSQNNKLYYTVNGEPQEILATHSEQTIKQILERANFTPVEKFKLYDSQTETEYAGATQVIKIKNHDKFLALTSGPTPVA